MATWSIKCNVLIPKKGDNSIFPELEIIEKEIHLVENSVINIFTSAVEKANSEFEKNLGYSFVAIERTDKKTDKNYYPYITNESKATKLGVLLSDEQQQVLSKVKFLIYDKCSPSVADDKARFFSVHNASIEIKPNVCILKSPWGQIMEHNEYQKLKNFYEKVSANEIKILNIDDFAVLDSYDYLRDYYHSQNFSK